MKRADWITRGEKATAPKHALYQAVSWLVDGVPRLFQRDEHICLENYDAASLEKLITWVDKKLGACFTPAKPYELEYYWCDPIDDDNELPEGMTWDPTACRLIPEGSAPVPAIVTAKSQPKRTSAKPATAKRTSTIKTSPQAPNSSAKPRKRP